MKNILFTLSCISLLVSGCVITDTGTRTEQAPAAAYGSSDEPFPVLNAYGNWFDVGIYGRVWQPAVMSDWRPYTLGQWVWTDRGWMWDSDEPFGWVVYHYGYWTQLGALGWVWVPGNDWSPARVNWYSSNDYVGWAPMCPPQASYPDAYQTGYENYWTVVPAPQFTRLNVGAYRTTPPHVRTPPSSGSRGTAVQRPPDIITIQGATHELIPARKTEQDQVRVGRRTVSRVRVDQGERPAPPAPVYVSPARPDAHVSDTLADHDSRWGPHSTTPLCSGRRHSSSRSGADPLARAYHADTGARRDIARTCARSNRAFASTRESGPDACTRAHHAGPGGRRSCARTRTRCPGTRAREGRSSACEGSGKEERQEVEGSGRIGSGRQEAALQALRRRIML